MALFVIQVAAVVAKKKAGLAIKLGRLGRLLRTGGTANGTMARIMVQQAEQTVLGLGDIQRVRKIAELATAGFIVAQAVAGLIQGLADQAESVDHIEAILENAGDPEAVAGALAAIQNDTADTDEFRLILSSLGEPFVEGDLATPAGAFFQVGAAAAAPQFIRLTLLGARGIESTSKVVRATSGSKRAADVVGKIAKYFKGDSSSVFAGIKSLDDLGVLNLSGMARRLASKAASVRAGEAFVLRFLSATAKAGQKVEVEKFVPLTLNGVKRPLRRFYDFVINDVRYECKRWTFTPPGSTFLQRRAIRAANEQWIRDLANIALTPGPGTIAQRLRQPLRWVFPKELNQNQIRNHFLDVLRDPTVRSKLGHYLTSRQSGVTVQQVEDAVRRNIDVLIQFF